MAAYHTAVSSFAEAADLQIWAALLHVLAACSVGPAQTKQAGSPISPCREQLQLVCHLGKVHESSPDGPYD